MDVSRHSIPRLTTKVKNGGMKMRFQAIFIMTILPIFIGGCANLTSIHRELRVDDGTGTLVDIKQRAVIVSRQADRAGLKSPFQTIVCAEPSPDALSAFATQFAAEAKGSNEVAGKVAGALQESSAFVGLRTQSIQLLRDGLYRVCEGYMNGALDPIRYDLLMRRYQKIMVTLLGIEQLTGAIRAPAVTIISQSLSEVSRSISDMREEINKIDGKIADIENKAKNDNNTVLKKQINLLTEDKKAIEKGIENARGLVAGGSAIANISELPKQSTEKDIRSVSDAVKEIVLTYLNADETGSICMAAWYSGIIDNNSSLKNMCNNYVDNAIIGRFYQSKYIDKLINNSKQVPDDITRGILQIGPKDDDTVLKLKIIEKWFENPGVMSDNVIKEILKQKPASVGSNQGERDQIGKTPK